MIRKVKICKIDNTSVTDSLVAEQLTPSHYQYQPDFESDSNSESQTVLEVQSTISRQMIRVCSQLTK